MLHVRNSLAFTLFDYIIEHGGAEAVRQIELPPFYDVHPIKIKNEKGINFVSIFVTVKDEYLRYTWKACPSSVTRSRKFTACIVHITDVRAKSTIVK